MRIKAAIVSVCFFVLAILTAGPAAGQESTTPAPTPAPAAPPATAPAPTSAQSYYSQAHEAFQKGDLDAVVFNCRMALSIKPDFLDAHYMLGKAHLLLAYKANRLAVRDYGVGSPETRYLKQFVKGRSDLRKAMEHFQAAVNLAPSDVDALLNLGIAQDNYGKEKEAIATYEKVVQLDPISTQARDAWNNLGLVYSAEEDYKKAKKAYEKALEIDPNFTAARMNLQRLLTIKPKLK